MKVLYCSPNKSHHYGYARQLHEAGALHAFVSGFPRWGSGAALPSLGKKVVREDLLQAAYLGALRWRLPKSVCAELGYHSKIRIDRACSRHSLGADLFLFYSGCGLETMGQVREEGGKCLVEAVNCHAQTQREILEEEHRRLGLTPPYIHPEEFQRRLQEYDLADGILLPSGSVRESFLKRGFDADRLIRLPYCPRVPDVRPENSRNHRDNAPFRILYVGSVQPRKGVRYLIEAFASIPTAAKELWIVGAVGNPSGLEGMAIPEGVVFRGVLRGGELAHAYSSSDVFCLPSLEEGMALVVGEALSYGLPVVTTVNSGASELMTHGREGLILPIRDTKGMKAAFSRMIDDPSWLGELRAEAESRGRELTAPARGKTDLPRVLAEWLSGCLRS
jgi:starch synthase